VTVAKQIPVAAYLSPSVLDEEIQSIFLTHWQPAAMLSDLNERHDFVVVVIGGREVVIQHFGDTLSAFTNVCSHRMSAIQTLPSGNRPLQCPYHRWTFDKQGIPSNIPLREDFTCLDDVPIEQLALERWHLEICGGMIFVCLARPTTTLHEYLGNIYPWLETVTTHLGYELPSFQTTIGANWKVIMQNTVEFQHVFAVHPQTFRPLVELPLSIKDSEAIAPHIRYRINMKTERSQVRLDRMLERHFHQPARLPEPGYEHVLLFPCLTVGHTNGRAFSFFQYAPETPGSTRLSVRTWMPRSVTDDAALTSFCETVGAEIAAFIQRLSDEDSQICGAAQRGLASAPTAWRMRFSDGEYLVAKFHSHYLEVMAAAMSQHSGESTQQRLSSDYQ